MSLTQTIAGSRLASVEIVIHEHSPAWAIAREPADDFTNRVRGTLIQRGTTLAAWAREHRLNVKTVFSAVYGQRHGQLSRAIRLRLETEIA